MTEYRRPESGSWDYRVVVREFEDGREPEYAIHEAHYDDDGVTFVTQDPVGVMSETMDGLRKEVDWIARALDAPPLRYEDYRVPVSERGDPQPLRVAHEEVRASP